MVGLVNAECVVVREGWCVTTADGSVVRCILFGWFLGWSGDFTSPYIPLQVPILTLVPIK